MHEHPAAHFANCTEGTVPLVGCLTYNNLAASWLDLEEPRRLKTDIDSVCIHPSWSLLKHSGAWELDYNENTQWTRSSNPYGGKKLWKTKKINGEVAVNLHGILSTISSTYSNEIVGDLIPELLSLINKFYVSLKVNDDLKNNITELHKENHHLTTSLERKKNSWKGELWRFTALWRNCR